eukprot:364691-Chlamydomonas_euryale.AAC.7
MEKHRFRPPVFWCSIGRPGCWDPPAVSRPRSGRDLLASCACGGMDAPPVFSCASRRLPAASARSVLTPLTVQMEPCHPAFERLLITLHPMRLSQNSRRKHEDVGRATVNINNTELPR